ncbi:MAG TPA: penicillin-binding transpeptidase domain-containing protein [Aquihabitans sp.]|nr:penicillin-binding transpeptidase domain-containing protein [Aquihabitans sp.]
MSKRNAAIAGGVVLVIAIVGAALWFGPFRNDDADDGRPGMRDGDPAAVAADAFAAAWQGGSLGKVAATSASGDVAARTGAIVAGLAAAGATDPTEVEVTSLEEVPPPEGADGDPARVRAALDVTWTLDGDRVWTYESGVELVEQEAADGGDPTWLVDWTPAVVHPRVAQEGERLAIVRAAAERGELLGADGDAIVGLRPVVVVGIQPSGSADPAATARQVAGIVGVDPEALASRVTSAAPDQVVSVITFREEAFGAYDSSLRGLPGVVLTADEIPLAPSRDFARALLGSVGPATEEIAAASQGRVQVGDLTGLSGLQLAQDEVLGGRPALSVRLDRAAADQPATVLEDFPAVAGSDLTITLDPRVQTAAEDALSSAPGPAALVAIRPSTGDVLAVANGPAGADGFARATVGRYPPGSTFKVATTFGLLQHGVTPDTVIACPPTTVAGKEFKNAGGFALGDVPFRTDFARSCNTAFVSQYRTISSQDLTDAAAALGYRPIDLGVPLFEGSVPVTDSDAEHASDMIGQGKVEASPFVVALMSASVAAGRSVEPRLIIDPASPEPVLGAELPAEPIAQLQALMRAVVTDGTGGAVADVPGGEVHGKSGTAEYGNEDPPQTHAWFTGYQGDVAFAVLVEGGSSGGGVAAPIAARFLTTLAQG